MARTLLTKKTLHDTYADLTAGAADVAFTAPDITNGNAFAHSGKELLLAKNTGASSVSITITSAPDRFKRIKHITYAVAAGAIARFGPFPAEGWVQDDGTVWVDCAATDLTLAVVEV